MWDVPAAYALYGGQGRGRYVAYVGMADVLKQNVIERVREPGKRLKAVKVKLAEK